MIDDNPIEEDESDDGGDSDVGGSKKRKKSDDEDDYDDRLEDDDYELLEENLGVKMERKVRHALYCRYKIYTNKSQLFQKQFKRLRRIQDEESDDDQVEQNEGDERDAIANELFDHSDNVSCSTQFQVHLSFPPSCTYGGNNKLPSTPSSWIRKFCLPVGL